MKKSVCSRANAGGGGGAAIERLDKAEMAFKLYDKDKDGYITKAEMTKLSKTLTKEQIDKVETILYFYFEYYILLCSKLYFFRTDNINIIFQTK